MNDKMAIFIFSVNVINRLLLSFLVLTKVITLSGLHCIFLYLIGHALVSVQLQNFCYLQEHDSFKKISVLRREGGQGAEL